MELLKCPKCGSSNVTLTAETKFMANSGEHYCNSVKTHDMDAKADCLDCHWQGFNVALNNGGQRY